MYRLPEGAVDQVVDWHYNWRGFQKALDAGWHGGASRVKPRADLVWASPRELLNVFQAHAIGCHIITVTNDILEKLSLVAKNLDDYSLETVKMFYDDAQKAGFAL